MGTKWEQEPKVGQEWEQSGNKTEKWDRNGNKVGTRTGEQSGNYVEVGQEWEQSADNKGNRLGKNFK